ncbi:ribosome small subunit-dependent GTPase A [Bacillus carboniphilus]|uniref:Small ribosomal subunit biogenesis GTPase RsgA n=1 Tax=Bacillus carboniphilus TaxID=86663 RepID=A0ABY9JQU0_9BACI|nr:ribosome small subunit-dependent GTPase A [Bacillus carboniphilus]WLR41769.1 ribosome small subunit-dependent GTPase A [Bacillus carboniphilus]
MNLQSIGWNEQLEQEFKQLNDQHCLAVGRVATQHRNLYEIWTEKGKVTGNVSGKLRYQAETKSMFPVVGDWVAISMHEGEERATIQAILQRKSQFSRKVAGDTTEEQVISANVDTVFLVSALNQDFNVRRIERYLVLAWESGANPVIVLNKADLADDLEDKRQDVEAIAFGVPIIFVSCVTKQGFDDLQNYMQKGETVSLIGSSGVGKSSIVNMLTGEEKQQVQDIREDDHKGRHTTTHRELILLESGLIMDTPGMREIQLWGDEASVHSAFDDISELSSMCKFNDCQHQNEPGCAVRQAIEEGVVSGERYESYLKLQREMVYLADKKAYLQQVKERSRQIKKTIRKSRKYK